MFWAQKLFLRTQSDFNKGKKIETNAEGEEFAFILGKK